MKKDEYNEKEIWFLRATNFTSSYLMNFKAVITIQCYNPKIRSKVMVYVHFEIRTFHYHRKMNQGFLRGH
jgi:hypothetical protein